MAAKKKATKKATAKAAKKTTAKASAKASNGKQSPLVWFGKLCAEKRKGLGWTQTELANHAQCCSAWVGTLERGKAAPSAALAASLMKSLKFTKDEKATVKERLEFKARKAAA